MNTPTCCPGATVVWEGQQGSSRTGLVSLWRCTRCQTRLTVQEA